MKRSLAPRYIAVVAMWLSATLGWPTLVVAADAARAVVRVMRVPDGGIEPQVIVDAKGVVHMIYFKGKDSGGDTFYIRTEDGGATFSKPLRVNSQNGSCMITGSVRGPHLAVGRNGRVHVAWMGSSSAEPKAGGKDTPMLYARMNDAGDGFEPQRNLIAEKVGLDGGGGIAADENGNVWVGWHAPPVPKAGEAARTVWIARSQDDGRTFAPETRAWDEPTGACACCSLRMFADAKGGVYVLYREAKETVQRDMYLLAAPAAGAPFKGTDLGAWKIGQCVMSTNGFARASDGIALAWETEEQVYWARASADGAVGAATAAPGPSGGRKHPSIAVNPAGQVLLAWAEGTGWQKGGSVAWQVFDRDGRPIAAGAGRARNLPMWGLIAVFPNKSGGFVVMY